jgi:hypothetical protein
MKINKTILAMIIGFWAAAIGLGMVWITDYTWRAGESSNSPVKLNSNILRKSSKNLPILLIFLHPQCSCSRATLTELARIMSRNENLVDARAIFYKPKTESLEWVETDLWRKASEIPYVTVSMANEDEIKQFGAITSGQTLLYDADGNLIFSGGITNGRGHEGESPGEESIESFLQNREVLIKETPVFGCILTTK